MKQTLLHGFSDLETSPPQSRIQRIGGRLEIPEAIATIDFTHGLHRFPGKFIPQVPRYIFENHLSGKSCVLDPFAGSGTTLVEGILSGHRCVGCDIDPLSVLIATAKVVPLSTSQLLKAKTVLDGIDWDAEHPQLIPDVPNFAHWFSDQTISQLTCIKKACLELEEPLKNFALVLFSSIIRRVSNADDQTQKTYVSHTKIKSPPSPQKLFPQILRRGLERMAEFDQFFEDSPECEVRLHDSRAPFDDVDFDDVVTSPPYIDSIDYLYNQMLEYFWLLPELGLGSHDDFRALRKRPMGMVKSNVELPQSLVLKLPHLEKMCGKIASKSVREAQAVKTFFRDYELHVAEIGKIQGEERIYATVVGSSLIRGQLVPTPDAIVAIHESLGYELLDRFAYRIKRHYMKFPRRENSSKITEDTVLVFRNVG